MSDLNRVFLRDMAEVVKSKLPDNYGFIVLAAPFNRDDGAPQGDNRLVYTSNIQRENAVALLKEFMLLAGAAEDWMKHIK
jgi:hypothetical protein